ncbi:hypothetical protein WMY93_018450 [Mugilogobius chulae]|uniref:Olfactory receptor n=1 Tax=Mugilogobius chulae TaxID=88201 RepID=A0AAW0NVP0_9GOBI
MSGVSPFRRHNSTPVSSFVLSAYSNPGSLRWLFFCVLLLLYLLMVFSNLLLIVVIALNRTLHEPMYLLLCSLFLNELYGSAALLPFLLVHILRDVHLVPAHFCFFQIYALHAYATIEFLTLASMSYDRYVAICQPLHYQSVMSWRKTAALVLFPWSYGLVTVVVMISLSSSLEFCGNVIDKVYCDNYPLVKLACYNTWSINVYGIAATVNVVCGPLVLILFSYVRILRVCQRGSRHTWHKAVHTCSPHLASLLNFTVAAFFEAALGVHQAGRSHKRLVSRAYRPRAQKVSTLCDKRGAVRILPLPLRLHTGSTQLLQVCPLRVRSAWTYGRPLSHSRRRVLGSPLVPVRQIMSLLDMMAAAPPVVQLGLLHMRRLQR